MLYSLAKGETLIGKKDGEPRSDIILGGIGIRSNHAVIMNQEGSLFIDQVDSSEEGTFLNGLAVTERK